MKYYTLVEQNPLTSKWEPQFGDYNREVVKDELQDRLDEEFPSRMEVMESGNTQESISNVLDYWNANTCPQCGSPTEQCGRCT